ncbi:SepL/TyeA/HrpJ family type III secretion system gatekeeper [Betaproteobacteria bacterium]|nr:SepL/TyeA/HrpJ family type III secretion system gatekeeper [Betaproteobacteria bacterium]GHU00166.1 SepL/TyeA/HrpJ family type III secretion system gatekeeper [Betaproteobacteria bacterium]GHU21603.1 SepL/TyeA/HrpJ family type III secretion system gatekeeper [Betaproteobacteria bacterium]
MADISVLQSTMAQAQVAGVANAPPAAKEIGSLAGFQVQLANDPLSTLADSAEELTFGVDNTKELALKERKTKEGGSGLIERVKLYQEIMEQSWRQKDAELLFVFLRNNSSTQTALARVREWAGGDPSEAWAFLSKAKETLQQDAPAAARDAIAEAMAQLEREEGPAIRAGILGAVEAATHPELGDAPTQGAAYRHVACDLYDKPEDMFDFIVEKYGMEHFDAGLDFLLRSLASDLAVDEPSHGKVHLEAVGAGLGQARILNGAHALVGRLLDRWANVHEVKDCTHTPMSLLKEMLRLKQDRYLSASSLGPLLAAAKAPDIEREVLFAQELLASSRSLSPLFFDGLENRMRFIDAVQETVDNAVAREDEWLASQG